MTSSENRKYLVVVWGATGFEGGIVCQFLLQQYKGVRWAMAGQNESKIQNSILKFSNQHKKNYDIPYIIANDEDQQSLDKLTGQTEVVINTLGPNSPHSFNLYKACINTKTHCVDMCKEKYWVQKLVEQFQVPASEKGIKIINGCCWEAFQFDLGPYLLSTTAQELLGSGQLDEILITLDRNALHAANGAGLGTILSKIESLKNNMSTVVKENSRPVSIFSWDSKIGSTVVGPSLLISNNSRNFNTSSDDLGQKYGTTIRVKGNSFAVTSIDALFTFIVSFNMLFILEQFIELIRFILGFIFRTFNNAMTISREDPSRLMTSEWKISMVGYVQGNIGKKTKIIGAIEGHHDPIYYDSAKLLLECALCLSSLNKQEFDKESLAGGVLPPSKALGSVIIDRLNNSKMTLKVDNIQ